MKTNFLLSTLIILVIVLVVIPTSRFFIVKRLIGLYHFIGFGGISGDNNSKEVELTSKVLELMEENKYLTELARERSMLNKNFVLGQAKILAISPDLTRVAIDRGVESGIRVGMNVIARGSGLAGVVINSQEGFATIRTIFDPQINIGVYVKNIFEKGVLRGGNSLKINFVESNKQIKNDELVLTSGDDGIFLKDLLVGFVKSVSERQESQFLDIQVDSYIDLKTLEYLFVIKNFEPKELLL